MMVLNWNIERLKHHRRMGEMVQNILRYDADVVVLTEADTRLTLEGYPHVFTTAPLEQPYYKATERRVIIYSKFPALASLPTYDAQTVCCPLLETSIGIVAVYGTILGIYGNRKPPFKEDLVSQIADWRTLSETYALCIAGDLNMSFSDNYYHTEAGRKMLLHAFEDCNLKLLTSHIPNNIDHVLLSKSVLIENLELYTGCMAFNTDKALSDHIGVLAGTVTME